MHKDGIFSGNFPDICDIATVVWKKVEVKCTYSMRVGVYQQLVFANNFYSRHKGGMLVEKHERSLNEGLSCFIHKQTGFPNASSINYPVPPSWLVLSHSALLAMLQLGQNVEGSDRPTGSENFSLSRGNEALAC